MSAPVPNPRLRRRIDTMIRLAAPALDLMLAVADRISRVIDREDPEYVPARLAHDGESARRGLRQWPAPHRG